MFGHVKLRLFCSNSKIPILRCSLRIRILPRSRPFGPFEFSQLQLGACRFYPRCEKTGGCVAMVSSRTRFTRLQQRAIAHTHTQIEIKSGKHQHQAHNKSRSRSRTQHHQSNIMSIRESQRHNIDDQSSASFIACLELLHAPIGCTVRCVSPIKVCTGRRPRCFGCNNAPIELCPALSVG